MTVAESVSTVEGGNNSLKVAKTVSGVSLRNDTPTISHHSDSHSHRSALNNSTTSLISSTALDKTSNSIISTTRTTQPTRTMVIPVEIESSSGTKTDLDVITYGEQLLSSWQNRDTQLRDILEVPIKKSNPEVRKRIPSTDSWTPGKSKLSDAPVVAAGGKKSKFYSRNRKLMSPCPDTQEETKSTKKADTNSDSDDSTTVEVISENIHWSDVIKAPSPMRKERKKRYTADPETCNIYTPWPYIPTAEEIAVPTIDNNITIPKESRKSITIQSEPSGVSKYQGPPPPSHISRSPEKRSGSGRWDGHHQSLQSKNHSPPRPNEVIEISMSSPEKYSYSPTGTSNSFMDSMAVRFSSKYGMAAPQSVASVQHFNPPDRTSHDSKIVTAISESCRQMAPPRSIERNFSIVNNDGSGPQRLMPRYCSLGSIVKTLPAHISRQLGAGEWWEEMMSSSCGLTGVIEGIGRTRIRVRTTDSRLWWYDPDALEPQEGSYTQEGISSSPGNAFHRLSQAVNLQRDIDEKQLRHIAEAALPSGSETVWQDRQNRMMNSHAVMAEAQSAEIFADSIVTKINRSVAGQESHNHRIWQSAKADHTVKSEPTRSNGDHSVCKKCNTVIPRVSMTSNNFCTFCGEPLF